MPLFPRSIAERAASDIRRYTEPDRGGHFMAFEEPQLLAQELTAFMREVELDASAVDAQGRRRPDGSAHNQKGAP